LKLLKKIKMHRQQPTINKILSKKWDDKLMEIHLRKLDEVKPNLENKSPKYFNHLVTKPKHH
jgi:hypothetical protein